VLRISKCTVQSVVRKFWNNFFSQNSPPLLGALNPIMPLYKELEDIAFPELCSCFWTVPRLWNIPFSTIWVLGKLKSHRMLDRGSWDGTGQHSLHYWPSFPAQRAVSRSFAIVEQPVLNVPLLRLLC